MLYLIIQNLGIILIIVSEYYFNSNEKKLDRWKIKDEIREINYQN